MGIRIDAFAFEPAAFAAYGDAGLLRARDDSHGLLHDLMELARAPERAQSIRVVVSGSRRWWVSSFIESCRDPRWYVDPADRIEAEALLARLLRGHDCGALLRPASYAMGDAQLPVKPREDCDKLIATFEPTELAIWTCTTARLEAGARVCQATGRVFDLIVADNTAIER